MWLVICSTQDLAALWVYRGLQLHLNSVELVSVETLAYSLHWEHRLGRGGNHTKIHLADGRTLCSDSIQGIFNRANYIPTEHFHLAHPHDRDYAIQEFTAFFMSWMNALPCAVVNRPTAQGLSGAWRHESEWIWLAGQAGLPTSLYQQSSYSGVLQALHPTFSAQARTTQTVIVVGDQVCGASVPASLRAGCQKLAQLANTPLLGIDFSLDATGMWYFKTATPTPDVQLGGQPLLQALTLELQAQRCKL